LFRPDPTVPVCPDFVGIFHYQGVDRQVAADPVDTVGLDRARFFEKIVQRADHTDAQRGISAKPDAAPRCLGGGLAVGVESIE